MAELLELTSFLNRLRELYSEKLRNLSLVTQKTSHESLECVHQEEFVSMTKMLPSNSIKSKVDTLIDSINSHKMLTAKRLEYEIELLRLLITDKESRLDTLLVNIKEDHRRPFNSLVDSNSIAIGNDTDFFIGLINS